jgi:uncharacterized membrane protein
MPHLSELHGATTHLAVIAVPGYALVLALRRFGPDHQTLAHVEPWLLGAAILGILSAGITGLLVWGQAKTVLRGSAFRIGTFHFWIGIALAVILFAAAFIRQLTVAGGRPTHGPVLLVAGTTALVLVFAQGYLGGRMTYHHGVGVYDGGQFAQTAAGAKRLDVALATGRSEASAGRAAFSASGLGCAKCHGDLARGLRAPPLAGGVEAGDFRRVHGHGLFPRSMVSDRDFEAINSWLRTLSRAPGRP